MADTVAQGPWSDYVASAAPVTDSTAAGPWSDYAGAPGPAETAAESVLGDFGASPAVAKGIVGAGEDIGTLAENTVTGAINAGDYALQRAGGASPQAAAANPALPYASPGPAGQQVEQDIENLPGLGGTTVGGDIGRVKAGVKEEAGYLKQGRPGVYAALAHEAPDIQNLINATPAIGAAHLLESGAAEAGEGAAASAAETAPAEAPPKVAPGPVTAEDLQQSPERLPPPPPRTAAPPAAAPPAAAPPSETPPQRVPVPGKPHIRPRAVPAAPAAAATAEEAPAATAAADQTIGKAPPTDEAEIAGPAPTSEEQQARLGAIQQLQADTGAVMPTVRHSAVNGDFRETGTDYQLGELGNPGMKLQLDQEQQALKAASKQTVQSAGGVADGVEKPALLQRGQIIDKALSGIGDWFDTNISKLYRGADGAASQRPMTLEPNPQTGVGAFHAILSDPSQFTGIEGRQLAQDVQQVGRQFGLIGGNGFWSPTTVENAERFRQWLGEQYTPRTGRTIGRLKDALDSDVAAAGGGGLYDQARALRFKRDQMLAGAKGIEKLLPEKRPDGKVITRPVPVENMADHVANLPTAEFNHVINVLHDSSKLGNGELAPDNAAAINEIRRHMAERLHEAGTKQKDGFWDPHAYHSALNNYSTKMPAVFSPEGIRRFQTIHDAGNALRVNKRYGGAIKQAQQYMQGGGWSPETRKRIAGALPDLVLGRMGAAAELLGIGNKAREFIERKLPGGNAAVNADEAFAQRTRPLGQRIPKQGGWIGDLRKSKLPPVEHSYDPYGRDHTVSSEHGTTTGMQRGKDIQIVDTQTSPEARGKGEAAARAVRLADEAHAGGGNMISDTQVSSSGQKVYPALAHLGYDVRPNTNVERSADGTLRSTDSRPVFTVGPPKRPPLRQGYDPAAGLVDEQARRDAAAAQANPNGKRPPLAQGTDAAAPIYEAQARADAGRLAAKFPGQRGGPKYQASKTLENFVRSKAPPHRVDENGPSNWEDLKARGAESPMPINPHGAEGSIYSNVPTNIAFRAWHDATHLALNAGFDHEGELAVAMEHQRQAKAAGLSPEDRKALWADTWETFKHHEQTGEFPKDPQEFVGSKMAEGQKTLAQKFPGQRGGPKVERQTETAKGGGSEPMGTLNIGLHVGDPANGGHVMDPENVKKVIKDMGYQLGKTSVVHSNTEPTLVADVHGMPVSPDDLHDMSQILGQGAIAQRLPGGGGMMEGPQAKEWGTYNPAYFRMHDGRTASEHLADKSTVTSPQRMAYPGIYDKPSDILSRVKVAPEDPILKNMFGVTRKDLHDAAVGRTSNMKYDLPNPAKNPSGPRGSKAAAGVMNDKNAQRLVAIINEAKKNPELYHGMAGWYVMDPLFKKVVETVGRKAAPATYSRLNAFMGMASPGSDVASEINRGTAAHMMDAQGKFDKFVKYGGRPAGARGKPLELAAVAGHPYHSTAQAGPMRRYVDTGALPMSPKVPTYIAASGVPETGFQNHVLVGDSHWSRGVGLSDTRTNQQYAASVEPSEIQQLHPWYKEKVAKAVGLPPTSAQAVQWGALSHETGVDTEIGAPKLEIFAKQVRKAAARLKVTPEEALKRIIKGTAHAG